MNQNETFSLTIVPPERDACSCGVCFARNVPDKNRPARKIYELRVGTAVTRLCESCAKSLMLMLDSQLHGN